MYAVVYKNRVIVGPMGWNRGLFQGSLEKEKIKVLLPRVAPEELPYVINDDAKIMSVEEIRPELTPLVEYHYGPIWDLSGEKAIANYEIHDTSIESARENFKSLAAEERWKKEIAGTKLTVQGTEISIDTTRESRNIFIQRMNSMGDEETVNWKFSEGWITLNKTDLSNIVAAGMNYIQSCFDWEKAINDQIDMASTKEDLLAIEIVEKKDNQINSN